MRVGFVLILYLLCRKAYLIAFIGPAAPHAPTPSPHFRAKPAPRHSGLPLASQIHNSFLGCMQPAKITCVADMVRQTFDTLPRILERQQNVAHIPLRHSVALPCSQAAQQCYQFTPCYSKAIDRLTMLDFDIPSHIPLQVTPPALLYFSKRCTGQSPTTTAAPPASSTTIHPENLPYRTA